MHDPIHPATSAAPGTTAIRLSGRDALPLVHRISTNALLDLAPGAARPTLFCDYRGRLFHRAIVYLALDRTVWLLRDDAPGADLTAFLDRHVFRDDVAFEDHSSERGVSRVAKIGGAVENLEEEGVPRRVVMGDDRLEVGGTPRRADERARILAGHPAHGHEIVEAYNPFEVGLGDEVHLDKGCYTGQEALQRLVTYQSVRRRLALVEGLGPVPANMTALEFDGERGGAITSAIADSPERWIGLAVVRAEKLDAGLTPTATGLPLLNPPQPFESPRPLGRP